MMEMICHGKNSHQSKNQGHIAIGAGHTQPANNHASKRIPKQYGTRFFYLRFKMWVISLIHATSSSEKSIRTQSSVAIFLSGSRPIPMRIRLKS